MPSRSVVCRPARELRSASIVQMGGGDRAVLGREAGGARPVGRYLGRFLSAW